MTISTTYVFIYIVTTKDVNNDFGCTKVQISLMHMSARVSGRVILGSPGALCLAMACSQRSSLLWKARWHPSKGHSKEAMAGADGATRWFGGGPSAAGDAGPSAGGTPA